MSLSSRRLVLLVSALSGFLTSSSLSTVSVAVPAIAEELSMDAPTSGWVITSFLLACTVFLVPLGRVADIKGRKRVFILGNVLFVAFSMLCGLSASAEAMLGLRFLQGIGGAMIYATGVALISSAFPPQERGRALGLYTSSVYVGLTTGPLIGGALTGLLSWRYVFFFNVPLGCLVIALTISRLKGEWVEAKGERLDLVGSAVYGLATALLVVGLSLKSLVGVVLGTALLAAFAFWELREKWPVLEVKLFKNVTFAFSNLAALINYAATYAVSYALSLYLQHVKGMPPHYAGFVLTAQPAVQALVSPLAGYTADRVEPRVVASIGMALTAVGLWSLSGIGLGTSVESIIMGLMFVGVGLGLFVSPNTKAIMNSVSSKFYGVASAMTATMRNMGQAMSMAIITLLMTLFLGVGARMEPSIYPVFVDCLRTTFQTFSAICVAGVVASLARGKVAESSPRA